MSIHNNMNEDVFERIFETYKNQVYGFVFTLTRSSYAAEEITQDIFVKLWLSRVTLDRVDRLDGYLVAMAHKRTLNLVAAPYYG